MYRIYPKGKFYTFDQISKNNSFYINIFYKPGFKISGMRKCPEKFSILYGTFI